MNGVDVSDHQPSNVLTLFSYDFAIVKITQGSGMSNKNFAGQIASAKGKGVYGVYHFDHGRDDWQTECDAFINNASANGIIGNGILFWDWEGDAKEKGISRLANIRQYLKQKLGYTAIYLSGSYAEQYSAEISQWDYVWVAAYGKNNQQNGYRDNPTQTYWPSAIVYQYNSRGRLGNYKNDLDLNHSPLSPDQWKAIAAGSIIPAPAPPPAIAGDPVVASFQQYLNDTYRTGLNADGRPGPLTRKAMIKGLQTEINKQFGERTKQLVGSLLAVDGIFGKNSKKAMPIVKQGASGNISYIINAMLYMKGYNVTLHNVYDANTANAVFEFQKSNGLSPDRITGPNTMERLAQ